MRLLLVNPPIYDFSAYDFWLKPYGMLRVAGMLRRVAEMSLFDYLDRRHPSAGASRCADYDEFGRGPFPETPLEKPAPLGDVPRRYRRFGLPRAVFREFLARRGPFDAVLVQTVMTYWYPGVREVVEDLRSFAPEARIVLGGVYATLCSRHAESLGADFVVSGIDLASLWRFLGAAPDSDGLPFWEGYPSLSAGVLKLADGCPFKCTYCSVPQVYPGFESRGVERGLAEYDALVARGVRNLAFYDDALLYRPERILVPFLEGVLRRGPVRVCLHTPNALNARFITRDLAALMVRAGFKSVYLGFESNAYEWQRRTGGKVYSEELAEAVACLKEAGADGGQLTAYLILGHPGAPSQDVEASMRYAHSLGLRVMLADYSPIPGTPDGERCRGTVDLDEPLNHNKTAFPIRSLGEAETNRIKALGRALNGALRGARPVPLHAPA